MSKISPKGHGNASMTSLSSTWLKDQKTIRVPELLKTARMNSEVLNPVLGAKRIQKTAPITRPDTGNKNKQASEYSSIQSHPFYSKVTTEQH